MEKVPKFEIPKLSAEQQRLVDQILQDIEIFNEVITDCEARIPALRDALSDACVRAEYVQGENTRLQKFLDENPSIPAIQRQEYDSGIRESNEQTRLAIETGAHSLTEQENILRDALLHKTLVQAEYRKVVFGSEDVAH